METPHYVKTLLNPEGKGKAQARRIWGIDLEMVWVPFFTATNTMKETDVPPEELGAPLRLRYAKDGSVVFSQSGRPSFKVAAELNRHIQIVRENFVAGLQAYTGSVIAEHRDDYRAQVEAAQQAGRPIIEREHEEAAAALLRMAQAEAAEAPRQNQESEPTGEAPKALPKSRREKEQVAA